MIHTIFQSLEIEIFSMTNWSVCVNYTCQINRCCRLVQNIGLDEIQALYQMEDLDILDEEDSENNIANMLRLVGKLSDAVSKIEHHLYYF